MADLPGSYAFTLPSLRTPPPFSTEGDAKAFLRSIKACGDISDVAYLAMLLPSRPSLEPYVLTTYSDAWSRHYFARQYFSVDPAISVGMSGILPFDWHSVPTLGRPSTRFFGEALDFGLAWNGLSIPIRGALGEKALFSINSPLLKTDWQDFKITHLAELTIFAYLFHLRILGLVQPTKPQPTPVVRRREREVLQWAARGKSSWETAQILGLSETTVNFYIRNVAVRLGAANKTQAVAVALRSNLL